MRDRRTGKWEKIGGVETYVATPTVDYPKDKAILFLPDVFGPQLINNRVRLPFFPCRRTLAATAGQGQVIRGVDPI